MPGNCLFLKGWLWPRCRACWKPGAGKGRGGSIGEPQASGPLPWSTSPLGSDSCVPGGTNPGCRPRPKAAGPCSQLTWLAWALSRLQAQWEPAGVGVLGPFGLWGPWAGGSSTGPRGPTWWPPLRGQAGTERLGTTPLLEGGPAKPRARQARVLQASGLRSFALGSGCEGVTRA